MLMWKFILPLFQRTKEIPLKTGKLSFFEVPMEEPVLILSKLIPPRFGTGIIARPRLVGLVDDFQNYQVLMVQAPAGYGKTVFLSQMISLWAKPVVWYQLDEHDNDPVKFLRYLTAGIRESYPGFGENIAKSLFNKDLSKDTSYLAGILLNALARLPELSIMIDDYHIINDPSIHDFVYQLIHQSPAQLHFVISSRKNLPWNLSREKLAGRLKTIDTRDLRFSSREIELVLIENKIKVDSELIRALENRSDGWPLAVSLLLQTMIHGETGAREEPTTDLFDYLASEVLEKQAVSIRQFLLATSILEEVTPEFCDLLLNRNDSLQILRTLAKEQCFLTMLRGKRDTYRYHPLFREFLNERLGEERNEFLHRAGVVKEQTNDRIQAVEYYLTAGDYQSAIRLIKQGGRQAIKLGHWQTVSRWLDTLPPEELWVDSWLALYRAEILINRGSLTEAESYLTHAEKDFQRRLDWTGYTEVLTQQARILRFQGRYQESLHLLEKALSYLPQKNSREQFHLKLEQTVNLGFSGRITEAEMILKEAIRAAEPEQNEFILAHLAEGLANIYYMKGDYIKSLEWYRRSETGSPDPLLTGYVRRNNKALIYLEWGELDRALQYAKQDVDFKERLGLIEALPLAYLQLGLVQLEHQELESAGEYIRRAVAILEKTGGERLFLALGQAVLTRYLIMQNKLTEARLMLDQAWDEAGAQSEYALAICQVIGAPVLFMTGEMEKGLGSLEKAIAVLEQVGASYFQMMGTGFLAVGYFFSQDGEKGFSLAEKCLKLAARGNYIQFFCASYQMIQPVLRFGLEKGVEVPLINRILVHNGAGSYGLLQNLARHPDPEVRRRTIIPLLEIEEPGSKQLLQELANDPVLVVREQANQLSHRFQSILPPVKVTNEKFFIRIELLGPLRIFAGETEITTINWRMKKTRDLLIYLQHISEPVAKEKIIEALWPEVDTQKASQVFHTALHYLRRILADFNQNDELITYGSGKYQLMPFYCVSDQFQFISLIRHAEDQSITKEESIRFYEKAVNLYRGDYLEDLDYDWVVPERERVKHLYCNIRQLLAEYYRQRKDYTRAIMNLRILLNYYSYSEEIAAKMMTVYAESGDWAALKEYYRQFNLLLKTDLELTPSDQLIGLFNQLIKESK